MSFLFVVPLLDLFFLFLSSNFTLCRSSVGELFFLSLSSRGAFRSLSSSLSSAAMAHLSSFFLPTLGGRSSWRAFSSLFLPRGALSFSASFPGWLCRGRRATSWRISSLRCLSSWRRAGVWGTWNRCSRRRASRVLHRCFVEIWGMEK